MKDQNNFLVAVLLSLGVLLGWQFFVTEPRMAEERAARQAELAQTAAAADPLETGPNASPSTLSAPSVQPNGQSLGVVSPQAVQALASGFTTAPRLAIETPNLVGSISLMGARFDDLILPAYGATAAEDAPRQRLLQRQGETGHWQAHHGFVSGGSNITLPDEKTIWQIVQGNTLTPSTPVVLAHTTPEGVRLTQRISVDDSYMFTITQGAQNKSSQPVTLYPFGQITRSGRPETTDLFILHEGPLGFFGTEGEGLVEADYDDLFEDGPVKHSAEEGWIGFTDKYWAAALVPPQDGKFTGRFMATAEGQLPVYRADFLLAGQSLAPGQSMQSTSQFFAGAKTVDAIDGYAEAGVTRFDLLIDWGWFYFLPKPMFTALHFLYALIGNYGLAILLVTVMIKIAFFPLASRSYETMAKMKKLQPRMVEIREKHKEDKQAQQQELMKVYREEKLNPLAGCLPILVQIPVFFALYKVLFV
ncbi:MAG: membrane protein insertase YidC, partial [Rhodobiaceae bacterium]|nr:membrane protein insertase YidC [Rhodobiaceae bacterium]